MVQTIRHEVPVQGRLVVVPIPDDVEEADVVDGMRAFLVEHSGVPRCAALVAWADDDTLVARDIDLREDESPNPTMHTLRAALGALLTDLFGTSVRPSWGAVTEAPTLGVHVDELSTSFLRELHEFVAPKTTFIALLTERIDPGAIVRKLRHLQRVRVIYGGVPQCWAANSA